MGAGESLAREFVAKLNSIILFPIIALLSAVALLFFLYGAFIFILKADSESERATGKQHMLFGIIGLLVMFSAFAILNIAAGTFGLGRELDCFNDGINCPPISDGASGASSRSTSGQVFPNSQQLAPNESQTRSDASGEADPRGGFWDGVGNFFGGGNNSDFEGFNSDRIGDGAGG